MKDSQILKRFKGLDLPVLSPSVPFILTLALCLIYGFVVAFVCGCEIGL